ncbi:MAG: hypothetical protein K9N35_07065 [Candidatus Marinimicrobia bacterium]|nr:hypothetical protein [Candidatus Neomarinimicrobiota bacterium]
MSRNILLLLLICLMWNCTGLDDKKLPTDANGQIYFEEFELNTQRNYLLVKLVNESPYTLTSCKFSVNFYSTTSSQESPLILTEVSSDDVLDLLESVPKRSEIFFIRETLKPGYSTEVYFELNLDDLSRRTIYTQEILELKGKISP